MFPVLSDSTLLAHIPFHFNPDRMVHLQRILNRFEGYPFSRVVVVVDTNTSETEQQVDLRSGERVDVRVTVHGDLSDPFRLTWQHREIMAQHLEEFD